MKLAGLVLIAAPFAFADSAAEAWDVIATMAAALAEPNDAGFMKPIAKSFAQHDLVERNVRALVQTCDVVSSISALANEGDDKQRTMEVDWYLEIQPRSAGAAVVQRREAVRLTLTKTGKRWMVTALEPVGFFTPVAAVN